MRGSPSPLPKLLPRFFSGSALGSNFALNSRALRALDSDFALNFGPFRAYELSPWQNLAQQKFCIVFFQNPGSTPVSRSFPQNGVWIFLYTRIILSIPECEFRLVFFRKSVEYFLSYLWVSKDNVAIWQNADFVTQLVNVCIRFQVSLKVLKLLSKIWINLRNLEQILAVFAFFSARWRQKNFSATELFK